MHWLITYPSPFLGPSGLDHSKLPIGLSPIIPLLVRVVRQRLALLVHFTRRIVVFLMSTRSRLTSHWSLAPKKVEKQEGWDARWLSLKQLWKETPWKSRVHQRNGRALLLYLEPSSHHHAQFVHSLDEQSVQCVEWDHYHTFFNLSSEHRLRVRTSWSARLWLSQADTR